MIKSLLKKWLGELNNAVALITVSALCGAGFVMGALLMVSFILSLGKWLHLGGL